MSLKIENCDCCNGTVNQKCIFIMQDLNIIILKNVNYVNNFFLVMMNTEMENQNYEKARNGVLKLKVDEKGRY